MHLLSSAAEGVISQALTRSDLDLRRDDQESIARIEHARTPDELLDLAPIIVMSAEQPWRRRVQAFGPEILPLISARLKVARDLEDKEAQTWIEERLVSVLYGFGDAGAAALIHCFDDLNDYAKSLASVVLGLLGAAGVPAAALAGGVKLATVSLLGVSISVKRERKREKKKGKKGGLTLSTFFLRRK
jgi:hypothetical protein